MVLRLRWQEGRISQGESVEKQDRDITRNRLPTSDIFRNWCGDSNVPKNAACMPRDGTQFSFSSMCAWKERQKKGALQQKDLVDTTFPSAQA